MARNLRAGDIAHQLGKAQKSGEGWMCLCPAHDDNKPSFWIIDTTEGNIRFKCHAGCIPADVKRALESEGLWPEFSTKPPRETDNKKSAEHKRQMIEVVWPVPSGLGDPDWTKLLGWTPTTVYEYRDAHSKLLQYVARSDRADGKEIRPVAAVRQHGGQVVWQLSALPSPRPLYRLDTLAKHPNWPVILVEGEKAADAAGRIFSESVAMTFSGGANAVDKSDFSPLRGRDVFLWPDNDAPGKAAMGNVAKRLKEIGAKSVRLVELPPSLPDKWDLADPLPVGLDVHQLLAEAKPLTAGLRQHILTAKQLATLELPKREFIVEPFMAVASLSMVYAQRGLGKTWFSLAASKAISEGSDVFGFEVHKPRNVLFIDGEMTLAELQERLRLLSAQAGHRLMLLPSEILFRADRPLNINQAEDQRRVMEAIEALAAEGQRPELVVLDNLSSLSSGIDENDNGALDTLLQWLRELRHQGIAVLLVHHAGKSGDQRGASRREDLLDTSIRLEKPKEASPHSGAHFIVEFTKTRGRSPKPSKFELRLVQVPDGTLDWLIDDAPKASAHDRTLRAIAVDKPSSQRDLAKVQGVTEGSISQHCKTLRDAGLLSGMVITPAGQQRLISLWPELANRLGIQDSLPI